MKRILCISWGKTMSIRLSVTHLLPDWTIRDWALSSHPDLSPGLFSSLTFGFSQNGDASQQKLTPEVPWGLQGRLTGDELKEWMDNYRNTLRFLILADDQPHKRNGVTVDP